MLQATMDANAQMDLARRYLTEGNLVAAEQSLAQVKAVIAPHPLVHEYLGFIALQREDKKLAIRHYRKAVKLDKKCPDLKSKLAEVLLSAGDEDEAVKLAQASVRIDSKNIAALNLLGIVHGRSGRLGEANKVLKAAVEASPDSFQSWYNLAHFRLSHARADLAVPDFKKALSLRPDHFDALVKLAQAYNAIGDAEAAKVAINRATELTADEEKLFELDLHRIDACYRGQQLDEATEILNRVEADHPNSPTVLAARAAVYEAQGQYEKALAYARRVKTHQSLVCMLAYPLFIEAQSLQGLGRHDEAAVVFAKANEDQERVYNRVGADKQVYIDSVLEAFEAYSSMKTQVLPEPPNPDAGRGLAFVNGFPRSGTTLIDAVLRMHSKIAVAEESPAATKTWEQSTDLVPGGPSGIGRMDDSVAEKLRATYFEGLEKDLSTDRAGKTAIDRHALGSIHAGLMKRLFPKAEFFLMVRHPCDAVLSAWFRNFRASHHTANYRTVEDTAKLYALLMRTHTNLEAALQLDAMIVRYEDLVADLRGTVEPMLHKLGLEWEPELEAFHKSKNRPSKTASFHQVSKPIYKSAVYRYEHYLPTLEPVMHLLEPWIELFGYPKPGEANG